MRYRGIVILAVLVALVLTLFTWIKPIQRDHETRQAASPASDNESRRHNSQATAPSAELPDPNDPRVTRLPDGRVLYNPSVEASRAITDSTSPEESLAVISQILNQYRDIFQENPVGENSEITAQLLGNNPKQIVFVAPDCRVLRSNELTDSTGTPLFFHALSSTHMEVVSAGPDLELWTDDDLSTGD